MLVLVWGRCADLTLWTCRILRGLIHGRPDPTTPQTLIVTDVFPLPIEGFETRVVADDGDVINHMIALGESLESTRKEKFSEFDSCV